MFYVGNVFPLTYLLQGHDGEAAQCEFNKTQALKHVDTHTTKFTTTGKTESSQLNLSTSC